MNKKDFTILVQGPLNKVSLEAIADYQKICDVVVSYWENDPLEAELPQDVIKVTAPLPDRNKTVGVLKDSTFYWAIKGINNGLKQVKTEYIVRTRSDERFEDLEYLMELAESTDKLVCGNIFVRSWKDVRYHIGDHVYCCKTKDLLNATESLLQQWDGESVLMDWALQERYCAEQILAHAYLVARGSEFPDWDNKLNFEKHFYVFDIAELGEYVVRWGFMNTVWNSNFVNHHGVTTMEDI